MSDLMNYIKQADIFYQLSPSQLEMVADLCEQQKFNRGEIVLEEGAASNELYIIIQGEVDILVNPAVVSRPGSSNGEITIATLRRGQSFGEIALVDEGVRSATVRASKKNTKLLVIGRKKLLMLCDTYPQLGYRLMYNLAADLAMKVRNTDLRFRATILYPQNKNMV